MYQSRDLPVNWISHPDMPSWSVPVRPYQKHCELFPVTAAFLAYFDLGRSCMYSVLVGNRRVQVMQISPKQHEQAGQGCLPKPMVSGSIFALALLFLSTMERLRARTSSALHRICYGTP